MALFPFSFTVSLHFECFSNGCFFSFACSDGFCGLSVFFLLQMRCHTVCAWRVCFKHLQLIRNSDSQLNWFFCQWQNVFASHQVQRFHSNNNLNLNDKLIKLLSFEPWFSVRCTIRLCELVYSINYLFLRPQKRRKRKWFLLLATGWTF